MKLLLHLLTSLHGTKRTCRDDLLIVRFRSEADMRRCHGRIPYDAHDPERS